MHCLHDSSPLPTLPPTGRILEKPPEMLAKLQALAERVRLCQQRLEDEKQAFEEVYRYMTV